MWVNVYNVMGISILAEKFINGTGNIFEEVMKGVLACGFTGEIRCKTSRDPHLPGCRGRGGDEIDPVSS